MAFPNIGWRTDQGPDSCVLEAGATYYLSFFFGNESTDTGTNLYCEGESGCVRTVQTTSF